MRKNPISSTIDFERDGIQHGHLRLPYSRDDSAWGAVMIPITQMKNGDGPTALITGANHGDEYEGPIALIKLSWALDIKQVQGRVIIVPAMNYPAFRVGRRLSPIDEGNLNRSFPGNPGGTITEKIADYFNSVLLPMADNVLDIHSGGKSLEFLPFAAIHVHEDKEQQQRCLNAMCAFGAPYAMYLTELDPAGLYDTAAEIQGKTFVTTELGGGGTTTPDTVAIAERGIENFLKHVGNLAGEPQGTDSVLLDMIGADNFIICEEDGLLEPCVGLGRAVKRGDPIARIWQVEHPGREPSHYRSRIDGVLAARHFPSLVRCGDCLAVIATVKT